MSEARLRVYKVSTEGDITEVEFEGARPKLEVLQGIVGGYIETVPYFEHITINEERHSCIAFCNEEGKLHGKPFNQLATGLWYTACGGPTDDVLVGDIAVVWGPKKLLARM